jgi:hypothetical protein
VIKHFIEYYYPGIFFAEDSSEEIENRDSNYWETHVKFPKNCFAFRFFDQEVTEGVSGNLYGQRHNYSGMFYNGGQVYTTKELERDFPNEKILIANSISRGTVIRTSLGNWQDFDPKKDKVIY